MKDAALQLQTLSGIRAVSAPKINAIYKLHQQLWSAPTQDFTLFSSTASLLGPPGQANYAAANAALDSWADQQSLQGKVSQSFQQPSDSQENPLDQVLHGMIHLRTKGLGVIDEVVDKT